MHPASKTIISFNIGGLPLPPRARARVREFTRLVDESDADVINMQELHTYGVLDLARRGLKSYPYVSYIPWLLGPRAGLVTFSRLPFDAKGFTHLGFQKGLLMTRLNDGMIIFNAHLITNADGVWSPGHRLYPVYKAQLDLVLAATKPHQDTDLILTGDFNLAKICDLYDYFVQTGGWLDAFDGNMAPTFHQEYLPKGCEAHCIDYVFVKGKSMHLTEARQMFADKVPVAGKLRYLSDHVGLWARIG